MGAPDTLELDVGEVSGDLVHVEQRGMGTQPLHAFIPYGAEGYVLDTRMGPEKTQQEMAEQTRRLILEKCKEIPRRRSPFGLLDLGDLFQGDGDMIASFTGEDTRRLG